MTTTADVLAEARRLFMGSRADKIDLLATAIASAGTTDIVNTDGIDGWTHGIRIAVGLEDMLVRSYAPSTQTASVVRGWRGSTAATAHDEDSLIYVNPIVSDFDILQAVNAELNSLSGAGLYQMKTVAITYSAAVGGYDLTGVTSILDVYSVTYKEAGTQKIRPHIGTWRLERLENTDDFASGYALILSEGGHPGNEIRVRYKAPFDPLAELDDDVTDVSGLHVEAHDLLALGAAVRVASGRELGRNFFEEQGPTRRADEVPPGAQFQGLQGVEMLRRRRLDEERTRLTQMFPNVNRGVMRTGAWSSPW